MVILLLLFSLVNWSQESFSQPLQEVKIGVLAKRGPEIALQKWSPTADYLTHALPGLRFHIVPLDFTEIHTAVQESRIDFVLANSAFYVELEKLYGVNRIATLLNQNRSGQRVTTFGGVILARSDSDDIREIKDLQGKSFMAVERRSFGGWIMCWRELHRLGLKPESFFHHCNSVRPMTLLSWQCNGEKLMAGQSGPTLWSVWPKEMRLTLMNFKSLMNSR